MCPQQFNDASGIRIEAPLRRVGLIGGLALRAGIFYYEELARRCAAIGQQLDLYLRHADVGTVLSLVGAGDEAGLGRYLGTLANELFDAGCAVVAITAVAPHMAIREVTKLTRGPLANVLDAIPAGMAASGVNRVGVFGNRAVMLTDIFGAVSADQVVRLDPASLEEVHAIYSDIALNGGRGTTPETERLNQIAQDLLGRGAQAIVLAGTDLSSFYAEQLPAYPVVDVARLHIAQILQG